MYEFKTSSYYKWHVRRRYYEPEWYMLMISLASHSGCSINHPVMFYSFYECLLLAQEKSNYPEDPRILSRSPNESPRIHELVGLLVNSCTLLFPAIYDQKLVSHYTVYPSPIKVVLYTDHIQYY